MAVSPLQGMDVQYALAAIVLCCVLIYASGTGGPEVFDDGSVLGPLRDAVARGDFWSQLMSDSGATGRPVAMLTFTIDAWLSGASTRVAKWVNAGIHVLNLLLAWRLVASLRIMQVSAAALPALWVVALWAVLPIHVSTVLYTVQRMTLLSAAGVLLGLNLLLATARMESIHGRALGLIGFGSCLLLATFSTENGVLLLPLGALLLSVTPAPDQASGWWRNLARTLRCVSLIGAGAFALWFFTTVLPETTSLHLARGWTPVERLLVEAKVLWFYVLQASLPSSSFLSFHHDDWNVDQAISGDPWLFVAVAAWLGTIGLALSARGRLAPIGLGLLFFILGHSLEASFLPLELVFEHRNYLPSLGLCMAFVSGAAQLPMRRNARRLAASGLLLTLSLVTLQRVMVWSSPMLLSIRSFQGNPQSPRAASALAASLAEQGELTVAVQVLRSVQHPGSALQALYLECTDTSRVGQGLSAGLPDPFTIRVDSYVTTSSINLSNAIHEGHCVLPGVEFSEWLGRVVDSAYFVHESERGKLALHVAHGLHDAGRIDAAIARARSVLNGDSAVVGLLLAADWTSGSGRCSDASSDLLAAHAMASPTRSQHWQPMLDEVRARLVGRGCSDGRAQQLIAPP